MRNLSDCTVLVVDDTETNVDILVDILGDDYEVAVAMDGESTLAHVALDPPDLILLDIMMPGMDGYAVCRSLKADKKTHNIPVIFVTAMTDVQDEVEGLDLGAVDYITKPVSPPIVRARVKTQLKLKLAREELAELLEKTLGGSIKMLTELLTIVNPKAFSRSVRLKRLVKIMASDLNLKGLWRFELAAMLSQIGCVALPGELLDKLYNGDILTEDEQLRFQEHPRIATALLSNVPRLETVSKIISRQFEDVPPIEDREDFRDQAIVDVGRQLLKTALDYDRLCITGHTPEAAIARMNEKWMGIAPVLMQSLAAVLGVEQKEHNRRLITVGDILPGMIIDEDVFSESGMLLAVCGTELSVNMSQFLIHFGLKNNIREPFGVLVPQG